MPGADRTIPDDACGDDDPPSACGRFGLCPGDQAAHPRPAHAFELAAGEAGLEEPEPITLLDEAGSALHAGEGLAAKDGRAHAGDRNRT